MPNAIFLILLTVLSSISHLDANSEIIKAGFGWWYFYFSKDKNLGKLQDEAKAQKLGLWSDPNAVSPWEYRKLKREGNISN